MAARHEERRPGYTNCLPRERKGTHWHIARPMQLGRPPIVVGAASATTWCVA